MKYITLTFSIKLILSVVIILSCLASVCNDRKLIPVTSLQVQRNSVNVSLQGSQISSQSFLSSSSSALKLSIEHIHTFPVVQQPVNHPEFVSSEGNQLTQFSSALYFGTLGFLAHNTLAGAYFNQIQQGDMIFVTMDNSEVLIFHVDEIRSFQANTPSSPYSTFTDLLTKLTYSAEDLFYQSYGVSGRLILQTCIEKDGIDNWGRLFIISTPADFSYNAYVLGVVKIAN